ncbi:MAG: iron-containing alcohol dehydrogenase [Pseudomonas sp.]|uniref:iron-containing alcohol dehydrogenase n=1 Tax=Pseudomonas sp. TaxID=306 RepID=UPI003D0CA4CB
MNHEFRSVPRIVCAAGALQGIGEVFAGLGARRVLLVCDPGIVRLGFAGKAQAALEAAGCSVAVFDQVVADPPAEVVEQAVREGRAFAADGVLGLGGGSSLDAAKLVALLVNSEQPLQALYGTDKARGRRLPLVLMPTTAGTGSEVTWVSVITDAQQRKQAVYSAQLMPDVAVLDPELTLGLPAQVTAATGLDAMVHAIEAYTSRTRKNPISDGLATTALGLLGGNLRKVLADGGDVAAREAMLQGSLMAGMAFVNASVAAIHGLAYPLGARFHIPHGHANALVMAPMIRFNLSAAQRLYAELAAHLLPGEVFADEAQAAEAFVQAIEGLVRDSGLETRLAKLGIDESALPAMAADVVGGLQRLIDSNPRDMDVGQVEAIYRGIY